MEPGVQRKIFLRLHRVQARSHFRVEQQIPTVCGHGARYQEKGMRRQQGVAKLLLPRTRKSGSQPASFGDAGRLQDVNGCRVGDHG